MTVNVILIPLLIPMEASGEIVKGKYIRTLDTFLATPKVLNLWPFLLAPIFINTKYIEISSDW